jgi:hypothetical protein
MKRTITAFIVLASFTYFFISCRKIDPLHAKVCQLSTVSFPNNFNNIRYIYEYNDKRLLTKLTLSFTTFEYHFFIDYNAKQQPVELRRESIVDDRIIYLHDLPVEVDEKGVDNIFRPLLFFKYDGLGRIIERRSVVGANNLVRWDYYGSSFNYRHRTLLTLDSAGNPEHSKLVYEYKYDDKINPLSTFPNINFNIFFTDFFDGPDVGSFDPIPENNIILKSGSGTFSPDSDSLFNFINYFKTYTYNNGYPVSQHSLIRQYNMDGTFFDQTIDYNYSYDCLGDKNFPKQ